MDLEKYLNKYNNVSKRELEKIRDCVSSENDFESKVRSLHKNRENEKNNGRPSLQPGPLAHILSVTVQPIKEEDKSFSIYGRIRVEYCHSHYGGMVGHDLYNRDRNNAEVLDMTNTLTLNGPDYSSEIDHAFMPMFRSMIDVELFDAADNVFAQKCFSLDDVEVEGGYEQVKSMFIPCEQGSITVNYVAIPFGVYCRLSINFSSRHVSGNHEIINVNGKVVARFGNTYGNYTSEECVLFKKESSEFERVEIDGLKMQLARCWVAVPAYSTLVVGLDLSDTESGRKIVNDTVELLAQPGMMFGDVIVVDDLVIQVAVAWFSPTPLGRLSWLKGDKCLTRSQEKAIKETEEMDTDGETESSSDDGSSSDISVPWELRPHNSKPLSSPAVEIFSVFIGRDMSKTLQIYGSISIDLLSCDKDIICYIFKRDEKDALWLLEHIKSTPILDGPRYYNEYGPLEMKFDIKDVDGRLAVKGYVEWDSDVLDGCCNQQLCSFIQGENGFAAVHYSIFPYAVAANIKVFVNLKTGHGPEVYGSIFSQYSDYDYSSSYKKDHYRSVLFMRVQDDSVQLNVDGSVPLFRSVVVVPTFSSLIMNVDLSTGASGQKLSCAKEIEIGDKCKTIETSDVLLRIQVDWCEIK